MAADEDKKEEEKFEFTPEGESIGYISLDQARVLAMRTAREAPGAYGRRFMDVPMAFEVAEEEDTEDHYRITISFRPAGEFAVRPGLEQFFIEKEGAIALRQVLILPGSTGWTRYRLSIVAIGLMILVIVAVGGVFLVIGGGNDSAVNTAGPSPTIPPIPITMGTVDSEQGVATEFTGVMYTLSALTVGEGTVELNPPGGTYREGTEVTATAVASRGWLFYRWTDDCTGGGSCTVAMTSDKRIIASFEGALNSLSVNIVGQGEVSLIPPGTFYEPGTVVSANAIPFPGWEFDRWSGACFGTEECTVTLTTGENITATFKALYTLLANTVGRGSVTLSPPGGIYKAGISVAITAVPSPGWTFDGSSLPGCFSPDPGNNNTITCMLTVERNRDFTVNFVRQ